MDLTVAISILVARIHLDSVAIVHLQTHQCHHRRRWSGEIHHGGGVAGGCDSADSGCELYISGLGTLERKARRIFLLVKSLIQQKR
jgi:hypothetical protein